MAPMVFALAVTSSPVTPSAFAAVNIAARRMGYSDDFALREARNAKLKFLRGDKSSAAVVAEAKASMRVQSEGLLA